VDQFNITDNMSISGVRSTNRLKHRDVVHCGRPTHSFLLLALY